MSQKTAGILISCSNHKMLHGSAVEGVARETWQPDLEKRWIGASGNSNSGPILVWVKHILVTLKNWLGRLLASSSQKYTQPIHVNLYVFVQRTQGRRWVLRSHWTSPQPIVQEPPGLGLGGAHVPVEGFTLGHPDKFAKSKLSQQLQIVSDILWNYTKIQKAIVFKKILNCNMKSKNISANF